MRSGFTLIELSIVLVILGLLVGGVLAGKSLIEAAELRSVGSDLTKIKTSMHAFRDKYHAWPGDMAAATSFWGKNATVCNAHTGTAATPGTCNGNGDNIISEAYLVWHHLALASLWEGSYEITPSIAPGQTVAGDNPGVNYPLSKYQRSGGNAKLGYRMRSYTAGSNDRWNVNENGSGMFLASHLNNCCGAPFIDGGGMRPADLWNLDTKMDDGKPGLGTWQMKFGYAGGSCSTTTVAATAEYYVSAQSTLCPSYYDMGVRP